MCLCVRPLVRGGRASSPSHLLIFTLVAEVRRLLRAVFLITCMFELFFSALPLFRKRCYVPLSKHLFSCFPHPDKNHFISVIIASYLSQRNLLALTGKRSLSLCRSRHGDIVCWTQTVFTGLSKHALENTIRSSHVLKIESRILKNELW